MKHNFIVIFIIFMINININVIAICNYNINNGYIMKTCKKCNIEYVVDKGRNMCPDCTKAYYKQYDDKRELDRKIYRKSNYELNKDKIREQHYIYYYNNKEALCEHQKQYYQNNKDVICEYQKQYKEKQQQLSLLKYTPDDMKIDGQTHHLYIVKHCELPIFKIGVTRNLDKRFNEIKRDFGKCLIVLVHTSSDVKCYGLERSLLNQYKSNKYKLFKDGHGKTEWLYQSCLNEVLNIFNKKDKCVI